MEQKRAIAVFRHLNPLGIFHQCGLGAPNALGQLFFCAFGVCLYNYFPFLQIGARTFLWSR